MQEVTIPTDAGEIRLETGRIARQADGAVVLRLGQNVLLATAVSSPEAREDAGFFPLTVEYREKFSASGRIPGSYGRREGRITDGEVLTSRLVDRSIRPLFPEGYRCETQVLITVLSADPEIEPSSLAILAASAALHVSDIPWHGPVAGLSVVHGWQGWRLFPTRSQRDAADLDLIVSTGSGGLIMVEGQGDEASEERVRAALARAGEAGREMLEALDELRTSAGREKRVHEPSRRVEALAAEAAARVDAGFGDVASATTKQQRHAAVASLREQVRSELEGRHGDATSAVAAVESAIRRAVRRRISEEGLRPDGRSKEGIRPIWGEVGWLPRPHGSAVFTRGETQALVTCTLGSASDEQRYETLEGNEIERFLLHYNFPPYSVGETRPMRGPGRREIGHGNLAHRALSAVLPGFDEFAYTIRLVSEISESNGSSSMATVCGGCLALMDAGVPLKSPVAGIAMGLIREGEDYAVLSDILGDEDHLGDMDFKVAGTRDGITAIQMDNKLGAIPGDVLDGALGQAREGRLHILGEMEKILDAPRGTVSENAPRIVSMRIRPERIRQVIGQGGKTIQELQTTTRTRIDINDQGLVRVYAEDADGAREARRRIEALTLELEVGKVYRGTVHLVRDFFAIVNLPGSQEGRLHVSELEKARVAKVQDVLARGDKLLVRVLGVDKQGKINLSRRAALDADESEVVA